LAANAVGGSVDVTSDYVVRGVSRSDGDPAVQADLHVMADNGVLVGLFASSARPSSVDHRSAELSLFAGYAHALGDDWRVRLMASYYGYPGSAEGSEYNYAELVIAATYSDWLDLTAEFSPDTPRYIDYRGLRRYAQRSADMVLHSGWHHRLAASGGAGYSQSGGPSAAGYPYWSVGAMLDLRPVLLSVNHLDTGSGADRVSYGPVERHEWVATLIWRF
jgi:uncharacterized protein (TIGR02001 family)